MRRRRPWPCTVLLVALLSGLHGCASDPSPLSPLAEANPEKHRLATQEMEGVALRNKEAEGAFFRKVRATPPADPDANGNVNDPQRDENTTDTWETP